MYQPGDYDLAGFIVGRVELPVPGRAAVRPGDVLLGLPSSGLHTNGYSLARAILFDRMGLGVADVFPGTGESVGDVLLAVHRSYLGPLTPPCEGGSVRALAHITGGGIPGNLSRALPGDCNAIVDLSSWRPGPVFELLGKESGLDLEGLYGTLNMGIGMIAIVAPTDASTALGQLKDAGTGAFVCGEVVPGEGRVVLKPGA